MVLKKAFGRVPGRASEPSRSRVDDSGGLQYVSRKIDWVLGFSYRGEYIGGRAVSGGGPGGLTPWWRGQGLGRATLGCGQPLVPHRLSFGLRDASGKIGDLAFVSSNYENTSWCSFYETQKQQKIGNWHCGVSLVG
jgi:hypothetical protein